MPPLKNIAGQKFGRLTALSVESKSPTGVWWKCSCDCGASAIIEGRSLRNESTRSCGCLAMEVAKTASKTHGMTGTSTHNIWMGMRQRCENPSNKRYKDYGGRGIVVCKRWHIFENFLKDMGERPSGLSIERKNNNKGYCKSNCKWATRIEQANNTRKTKGKK